MAGRYSFRGDIRRYASKPELNRDDFNYRYGRLNKPLSSRLAPVDSMPSLMRPWPSMLDTQNSGNADLSQSTQLCDISEFDTSAGMPAAYGSVRSRTVPIMPSTGHQGSHPFPNHLPPTLVIPRGGYPADALHQKTSNPNSPRLVTRADNGDQHDLNDIPAAPNRPLPQLPNTHSHKDVLPLGAVATPYLAAASDLMIVAAKKKTTFKEVLNPSKPTEPSIPEEDKEDMQGGGSLGRNSATKTKSLDASPTVKKVSSASTDGASKKLVSESPSLASKLSKSFYDLASGDRLKNWKSKLPSAKKQTNKDTVDWEVSPLNNKETQNSSKPSKTKSGSDKVSKSGDDSTYDLAQNYWKPKPDKVTNRKAPSPKQSSLREQRWRREADPVFRSHVTLSQTNQDTNNNNDKRNSQHSQVINNNDLCTRPDPFDLEAILAEVAAEDPNLVPKKDEVEPLATGSNTRASFLKEFTAAQTSEEMEHRTKKQANVQRLYEEVDLPWQTLTHPGPGHEHPQYANTSAAIDSDYGPLPPPARITPYSGVPMPFTKEGSIVKPIAFKPIIPASAFKEHNNSTNRPRGSESLSDTYYTYSGPRVSRLPHCDLGGRMNGGVSDTEASGYGREKSSTPKYVSDNELILGASANTTTYGKRQPIKVTAEPISRAPRQNPPSFISGGRGQSSGKKSNGDYDTVADFADQENNKPAETSRPFPKLTNGTVPDAHAIHTPKSSTNAVSFAEVGKDRDSHQSSGYGTVGGSGSYGSRHSSGIHVTPSPSDSGVAELEAALRDRENELAQLRMAMESNEHAVVRVYQEKEDRWHSKLQEWASRLDQAVQAEQRLLSQVQKLQDERLEMQMTVQTLSAEKHGLQRKCKEIESDYFTIKERLQSHERHWAICRRCGDIFLPADSKNASGSSPSQPTSSGNNMNAFPTLNNNERVERSRSRGDPSPSASPATIDPEIKSEIDLLRHEVHELRDSLRHQISAFAQERNRWDEEKRRVLDYQRALQDNYSNVIEKNAKLERRCSTAPDDKLCNHET